MNDSVALQETNEGWAFINEWQLEDFVWNNLQEIFGFNPLARQHSIKGEICDILAISNNDQLVIIELKNVEDRYVINQLTRYYDNLIEEKPFQDKINYDLEILLFAICPTFHRHNLIDQRHSRLRFSLFLFSIIKENDEFHFRLAQPDENSDRKDIKINYSETKWNNQANENIPEPPQLLLKWINTLTQKELENINKIRNKILGFDQRIEEIVIERSIVYASRYGKDKLRYCVEFRFDQRAKKILLFCWLLLPNRKNKTIIRMQIDTSYEYAAFWRVIPLATGAISQKSLKEKHIHRFFSSEGNLYLSVIEDNGVPGHMDLIDQVLQIWLERVSR
jgi:RecB family endonuclease NucS